MDTFAELVRRFTAVQGIPFREVAESFGLDIGSDPKRMKQFAGNIAEGVGGKRPDSASVSDLGEFDIEIKTVPLGSGLRPRENTKVTQINYQTIQTEDWWTSHAYRKLRVVLFVPIVKENLAKPESWFVRSPFVWMPSRVQVDQLRDDWEAIRGKILAGEAEALTAKRAAGLGRYLMPNTSGANAKDVMTYTLNGETKSSKRRAFWLRKDFVQEILEQNIRFTPAPI